MLYVSLDDGTTVFSIAISGNIAFVANFYYLKILNITNHMEPPQILYTYMEGHAVSVAVSNNKVYLACQEIGLQILDVQNPINPKLLAIYSTSQVASGVAVSGSTVFIAEESGGVQILDISTWQLRVQPTVADVGNYNLYLTVTDPLGGSVYNTFTIRVEGPPYLNQPITSVPYAKVGQIFSYIVPSTTFIDLNFDPLTYTVSPPHLPAWLNFDPISVTFIGTPTATDVGTLNLSLIASDPLLGAAESDNFNIIVIYVPTLNQPITQPMSCIQGRNCTYQIPADTFNSYGEVLSYSASSSDGSPLPNWLQFLPPSMTLFGVPPISTVIELSICAQSTFGDQVFTPLTILVNPNLSPVVSQQIAPQTASVGQQFAFYVPENTFSDPNGDKLTYTTSLAGGVFFPQWLTFDPQNLLFSGIPTGADTNTYAIRVLTINLVAHDSQNGVATLLFNINVTGNSYVASAINYSATAISVLLTALGCYKNRARISNRLKYKKPPQETLEIGKTFSYPLKTDPDSVASIKVKIPYKAKGHFKSLHCHRFFAKPIHYLQLPYDPLPGGNALPTWMEYDETKNVLQSKRGQVVPDLNFTELLVRVKDENSFVKEQILLKVQRPAFTNSTHSVNQDQAIEMKGLNQGDDQERHIRAMV